MLVVPSRCDCICSSIHVLLMYKVWKSNLIIVNGDEDELEVSQFKLNEADVVCSGQVVVDLESQ